MEQIGPSLGYKPCMMGGLMAISILYQLGQDGLETEQQTIVCAKKLLFMMPSILFLDVNMPYSDGPWMHPTCSGHHGFTCCCRMLPSKLRFMMVHVAVTWVFYAGTEDRAKHPIISRDVP